MVENKDTLRFVVPAVKVPFELAWPLTDFSKMVDDRLIQIGLAPELSVEGGCDSDEDYIDLYCSYADPNSEGYKYPIQYERSFRAVEIKNFARFREQDTILKDGQTYVPINILVQRFRDSRFGIERLEYCSPDEAVAFDKAGKSFKVKSRLHSDTPKDIREKISKVLTVSPDKLTDEFDQGYIKNLKFTPEETLEKIIQLYELKIHCQYGSQD